MPSAHRIAALAVLVVLAGCLSGLGGSTDAPPTPVGGTHASGDGTHTPGDGTHTPTPSEGTPPASPTASGDACPSGVAFWGLASAGEYGWERDVVRVGYEAPGNASILLVAFVDGTRLGETHVWARVRVAADGDPVELGRELSGTHVVRVVAYADANDNGAFDPGIDRQCRTEDGRVVGTEERAIDFDRFAANRTARKAPR